VHKGLTLVPVALKVCATGVGIIVLDTMLWVYDFNLRDLGQVGKVALILSCQ